MLIVPFSLTAFSACASEKAELLQKLRKIPDASSTYFSIQRIVIPLVKLDPERAPKYVTIGVRKFRNSHAGSIVISLIVGSIHFVNESTQLSKMQKARIRRSLRIIYTSGNYDNIYA